MKRKTKLFLIAGLCLVAFSAETSAKQRKATEKQLNWYNKKAWLEGINASPSPATDIALFASHYNKYPERWQLVFRFLRENNLSSLAPGKQQLSSDVTIIVQEYNTKAPGDELLEAHKKKIDLQYMVSGKELHGSAPLSETTESKAYDASNDAGFYHSGKIKYYVASPEQFSIFFPTDAHIPNVQFGDKTTVKKIVFKINAE